jgi:hypothetical protein
MNHGWPNIGRDAIIVAVRTAACDMANLVAAGLRVRVVSDVRRGFVVPPLPDRRGGLSWDRRLRTSIERNDGGDGARIVESPAWESPLFTLFDAVHAHPDAALIGATFSVMNRWLGIADPMARPGRRRQERRHRRQVLTRESATHPWFSGLARSVADEPGHAGRIHRRPALRSAAAHRWRHGDALAFETTPDGAAGKAVTMWEVARDRTGDAARLRREPPPRDRQPRPRPAHPLGQALARRGLARLVPRAR